MGALVRADIESLWGASAWMLAGSRSEYDPDQRQLALRTSRFVAETAAGLNHKSESYILHLTSYISHLT